MLNKEKVLEAIAKYMTVHKAISVDITDYGIVSIKIGVYSIVIQGKEEVIQIANTELALNKVKSFWDWDDPCYETLAELRMDFDFWNKQLKPAIFEIVDIVEGATNQ